MKTADLDMFDAIGWDYPAIIQYELTVNVDGNGIVDIDPEEELYDPDTMVTLSADAADGWTFDHWSGDDIDGSTANPEIITMNDDKEVTAHFTQDHYTLSIYTVGQGIVILYPDQSNYLWGDWVILNATGDQGWSFDHWGGHLTGSDNPKLLYMYEDSTVTAYFIEEQQNTPPETPLTPTGNILVPAGSDQSYSTSSTDPDDDQVFYQWDWGDEISGWLGPAPSGDASVAVHSWESPGWYEVQVRAKDDPNDDGDPSDGIESAWSESLSVQVVIAGDLDADGDVDLADLATLLGNYGSTSGTYYQDGDIDGDGDVDIADLAILLGNYGST